MPIIPLTCPNCGAKLKVNSDDPILTCNFCGGSFVMKDAIVHNYIQNTVNITAGSVNVVNQKDFAIEGGVLKKYQGEAMDVIIPDNVVAIGTLAFENLRIKSVVIPDSVEEIGLNAFYGCISLTSVTIPGSVKEIGNCAFGGCTALTSVTIPDSVKKIGDGAFGGCTSLITVTIPDSVKEIGQSAFSYCTALTSVTIPGSVKVIGENAFYGCTSLINLELPNNDEPYIIYRAFRGCSALFRKQGKCQHCGGAFKGMFTKVCSNCGKPKDY